MTLRYDLFKVEAPEVDYFGEIEKLIKLDLQTDSPLFINERYESGLLVLAAYEKRDADLFMQAVAQMRGFYEKCKGALC
jgi:hypothetical protein